MDDDLMLDDGPAVVRTGSAKADTPSARENRARFIRAIDAAGTRSLAASMGHSQGWVTRLKSDESRINLTELLIFLEETGLDLCEAGQGAEAGLLALAQLGLDTVSRKRPPGVVSDDEFGAVLALARASLARYEPQP